MPDKWEYPWFAAWDSAFHTIPLAMIDPEFAKHQLDLLTREWYMHPNGRSLPMNGNSAMLTRRCMPGPRCAFMISKGNERAQGQDVPGEVFQKLLLNFTWWVNRKDADGNNVFQAAF